MRCGDATAADACTTVTVCVSTLTTHTTPNGGGVVTTATNVQYHLLDSDVVEKVTAAMRAATETVIDGMKHGSKSNHVTVQVGFGDVTMHL